MIKRSISELPFWPRYLSREEAARYVGVSADVFELEVSAGLWPQPRRRGGKGGRLTWDRALLDATADKDSGIDKDQSAAPEVLTGTWGERSRVTAKEERHQRRTKTTE